VISVMGCLSLSRFVPQRFPLSMFTGWTAVRILESFRPLLPGEVKSLRECGCRKKSTTYELNTRFTIPGPLLGAEWL
jgi:hypothetical protein